MSLVEECPACGDYVTTPDGREDVFVTYELCERCRKQPSDRAFDEGFAEYEEARRIDAEDPMNLGPFS